MATKKLSWRGMRSGHLSRICGTFQTELSSKLRLQVRES
jgi:hypothetical protein